MSSIYKVNKGINREIEFKGLRGQYIIYMAVGLVLLLFFFAVMYIAGTHVYFCIFFIGGLGFFLFTIVYRLNHKYGTYGLMKLRGYRRVPTAIITQSRELFIKLSSLKIER